VSTWYTIRAYIAPTGAVWLWLWLTGEKMGTPIAIYQDPVLATGGALASGKVGIYDAYGGVSAHTRTYDNFLAWSPTPDAVINASQSIQLATNGIAREDSTGVAWGSAGWVQGDLPRLPVAGQEARSIEATFKLSRGDMGTLPDLAIDDASVRGFYRPCWLTVPGP